MENKVLSFAVGATICVILVASLLVPTIADSKSAFQDEYSNGPYSPTVNYATYSSSADFDVTIVGDGSAWTVSGIDLGAGSNGSYIMTDNIIIILSPVYGYTIRGLNESQQFISLDQTSWAGVSTAVTDVRIQVDASAITVSDGSGTQTEYTFPYAYIAYSDNEGDRVIITAADTIFTRNAEDVVSVGVNNSKFFWSTNGADSKAVYSAALLDTEISKTVTPVKDGVDEMTVGVGGQYNVKTTYNDTVYDLAPQYVCAPREILIDNTPGTIGILSVIPVLVIVALVIGAVSIFRKY